MSAGDDANAPLPNTATAARIVSMGVHMRYTGAPLYTSGDVTVMTANVSEAAPVRNYRIATAVTTDNTNTSLAAGACLARYVTLTGPGSSILTELPNDSYSSQLRQPLKIISKRTTNDYEWLPLIKQKLIPITEEDVSLHVVLSGIGYPGEALFDPAWESKFIVIEGAPVGGTVTFEVVVCTEYVPGAGDPSMSYAKAPASDPSAIKHQEAKDSNPNNKGVAPAGPSSSHSNPPRRR